MGTSRGGIRALHQIERITPIAETQEYAAVYRILFQDVHAKHLRIESFRARDVGDPEHKVAQTFYRNHRMNLLITFTAAITLDNLVPVRRKIPDRRECRHGGRCPK